MTRRYFVPDLPPDGGSIALPRAEAQHATRVMRVQTGEELTLFDGKGREAPAVVAGVGRNECRCQAGPPVPVDREPPCSIHLGIALPKPDRARELIERLTELGVKSVTPLVAERTQRPPSESLLEKLRRGVIEACKQSGRNELLQILPIQDARNFFSLNKDAMRLIAHPGGDPISLAAIKRATNVVAAIGPEGGWTDDEVRIARDHEFQAVDLGTRIYRIETTATVLASVLTA